MFLMRCKRKFKVWFGYLLVDFNLGFLNEVFLSGIFFLNIIGFRVWFLVLFSKKFDFKVVRLLERN